MVQSVNSKRRHYDQWLLEQENGDYVLIDHYTEESSFYAHKIGYVYLDKEIVDQSLDMMAEAEVAAIDDL